eukprot:scaffold48925_cov33-Tisochrysis_lutea.AAC.1
MAAPNGLLDDIVIETAIALLEQALLQAELLCATTSRCGVHTRFSHTRGRGGSQGFNLACRCQHVAVVHTRTQRRTVARRADGGRGREAEAAKREALEGARERRWRWREQASRGGGGRGEVRRAARAVVVVGQKCCTAAGKQQDA